MNIINLTDFIYPLHLHHQYHINPLMAGGILIISSQLVHEYFEVFWVLYSDRGDPCDQT